MATGDFKVFNEALAKMLDGDWASTDHFYCGLVTNGTNPAITTATPVYGDFTEVTPGGNYTAGGVDLGALSALVTSAANVMTFDSTTNPSWSQDAANPSNAYWGIVYNYTDAGKDALGYVDLGGPINMTLGDLTITWNGAGLFTITS